MRHILGKIGPLEARCWIHAVSIICVLSFIAFDVLDLDLSDVAWKPSHRQKIQLLAEVTKSSESTNVGNEAVCHPDTSFWNFSTQPSADEQPSANRDRASAGCRRQPHLRRVIHPPPATTQSSPAA